MKTLFFKILLLLFYLLWMGKNDGLCLPKCWENSTIAKVTYVTAEYVELETEIIALIFIKSLIAGLKYEKSM